MDQESNSTPPAVGELWHGQGGIYAGIMPEHNGAPAYHMIIATKSGEITYTATLAQAIDNLKALDNDVVVTLSNGAKIEIPKGKFSGSVTVKPSFADTYAASPTASITSVEGADASALSLSESGIIEGVGRHEWGGHRDETAALSLHDGFANTEALIASGGSYPAVQACADLEVDGLTDFYLAASAEMYWIWLNINGKLDGWAWSSTERAGDIAFDIRMTVGSQELSAKQNPLLVYPVRKVPV